MGTPALTVSLYGGLGNQMFQYAMGRALSLRHRTPLHLDVSSFSLDRYFKRKYELDKFTLSKDIVTIERPFMFRLGRLLYWLLRRSGVVARIISPRFIVETPRTSPKHAIYIAPGRHPYLWGYWQDARYFADCSDTIKGDFSLARKLSEENERIAGMIQSANGVAIHVRRLHEVAAQKSAVPQANGVEKGFALGIAYYKKAIAEIRARVHNPLFVVFSDYPGWARENLELPQPALFLQNNRGLDYEDMMLMSQCKHHVIANSSFSWWGAWLGGSADQVAVAPKNTRYTPNIPEKWVLV